MRKKGRLQVLFLLTGDVQIGKTRWLERVVAELATEDVPVAGVLAPGVWQERADGLEKLGIDNVLLPSGERIAFARRRDLALAEGTFDPESQSAAAQLAWHISDDSLARVNAHFDELAQAGGLCVGAQPGLLVVDELGRLELEHDRGLTSATALLSAGATDRFPHALVVVRDWLCPCAEERFAAAWGGIQVLAPDDIARKSLRAELGLFL